MAKLEDMILREHFLTIKEGELCSCPNLILPTLIISRVVSPNASKDISGYQFTGWGAHTNDYPCAYLTAAGALGMTRDDVDTFLKRLDKCLSKFSKKNNPAHPIAETNDQENNKTAEK